VTARHYDTTRPVYVLIREKTFSGAEEFAYDIQTQRRGEVVGDTTSGGAHPGGNAAGDRAVRRLGALWPGSQPGYGD
jgi:hypothetical protein